MARRTRRAGVLGALVAALLVFPLAWPAVGAGGGGGGGGGGGSGDHGGGEPSDVGSDYSDLVLAYRNVDGSPILVAYTTVGEEGEETSYCVQPVSYTPIPFVEPVLNPVNGEDVWLIPLQGRDDYVVEAGTELEACDPWPGYGMYVQEAELERLNMARTDESVIERKLNDVAEKLNAAKVISLDAAGRITADGEVLDASPEYAAIYGAVLAEGALKGATNHPAVSTAPAQIWTGPSVGGKGPGMQFGPYQMAAAAIGTAASKYTPLSVDAVIYYQTRIRKVVEAWQALPEADRLAWPLPFIDPEDEKYLYLDLDNDEKDYGAGLGNGFVYDVEQTFPGYATWFDVLKMEWKVTKVTELAGITNTGQYRHVDGFARMADDVRKVIALFHDHETIPGFYMDPVGVNTYDDQMAKITTPALSIAGPAEVIQTRPFDMTASLFNPWQTTEELDLATVLLTIDAEEAFTSGDQVTANILVDSDADGDIDETDVPSPMVLDVFEGNLIGQLDPPGEFEFLKLHNETRTIQMTVAGDAPEGSYSMFLELLDLSALGDGVVERVAQSLPATVFVNDDAPTVLWAAEPAPLITQGEYSLMSADVFHPAWEAAPDPEDPDAPEAPSSFDAELRIRIAAPDATPFTAASQATAYTGGKTYPLALDGGDLVGAVSLLDIPTTGYDGTLTWWLKIATTAPLGWYDLTLELVDVTADPEVTLDTSATKTVTVLAAAVHGQKPPGAGEDEEPGEDPTTTTTTTAPSGGGDPSTPPTGGGSTGGDPPVEGVTLPRDVHRVGGIDRIATAIALSQENFDDGSTEAVVIARADDYADALTAIGLADAKRAPLLLTGRDLDDRVLAEVERVLGAGGTVHLVGGSVALPAGIDERLGTTGAAIVRHAGADRFATAVAVAEAIGTPQAILLATGRDFPDALAGGPAAVAAGGVLLLTDDDEMPDATARYLEAHPGVPRYALGGRAVQADPGAIPVAGANRFATAVRVATTFFDQPAGIGLASGRDFADALAGGADAAAQRWPVLLTDPETLAAETAAYVAEHPSVLKADVYGGSLAVRDGVMFALQASLDA